MADQEAHAPEQQKGPGRGPANPPNAHAVYSWPGRRIRRETQFGAHSGNGGREQASEIEALQGHKISENPGGTKIKRERLH